MVVSNKSSGSGKKSPKGKPLALTIAVGIGKAKKIPKAMNNPNKGMKNGKKPPKSGY